MGDVSYTDSLYTFLESYLDSLENYNSNSIVTEDDDFDLEHDGVDHEEKLARLESLAPPQTDFFHGSADRSEAMEALKSQPVGSYLVRESVRTPGDYSLSVVTKRGIRHFKIIEDCGEFYMGNRQYPNLQCLVGNYMRKSLSDGVRLGKPIAPPASKAKKMSGISKQRFRAVVAHVAGSTDELSLEKGDIVELVKKATDDFWFVRKVEDPSQSGFVPVGKLEVGMGASTGTDRVDNAVAAGPEFNQAEQYMWGKIDRKKAEHVLMAETQPGYYLVRESTTTAGDYAVSLRMSDHVKHFKLEFKEGQYLCGGRKFATIQGVIDRYNNTPLYKGQILVQALAKGPNTDSSKPTTLGVEASTLKLAEVSISGPSSTATSTENIAPPNTDTLSPAKPSAARRSKYIVDGYLSKREPRSKKWKNFYFGIMGTKKLLYCFEKPDSLKPKGIIDLSFASVCDVHPSVFGRLNCFQVVLHIGEEHESIYLAANDELLKEKWVDALAKFCSHVFRPSVPDPMGVQRMLSLTITIGDGKNFSKSMTQPYILISINGILIARTQPKPVKNARWAETFVFSDVSPDIRTISFEVKNRNRLGKDARAGELVLSVANLSDTSNSTTREKWYKIPSTSDGDVIGDIRIRTVLEHEHILPLFEYEELEASVMDESLETLQILEEVGKDRDVLARHLVRIFRAKQELLPMIIKLISQEIKSTKDPNTLFRGNSLASKCMDQLMKMIAMDYLHGCIKHVIQEIAESKVSFEVDPSRIKQSGGTVQGNMNLLIKYLQKLWMGIRWSVDELPTELRIIFNTIRKDIMDTYDDVHVFYTCITGFLFLRLFCPAILNPKLFNMMDDHPTDQLARNLTLTAKCMQSLANLVEFGDKEGFLKDANVFIASNLKEMEAFLQAVAEMPKYPNLGVFDRVIPARDLAGITRFGLRHRALIQQSSQGSKDKLLQIIDSIDEKDRIYKMKNQSRGDEAIYGNV
eukprot:Clim_evm58s191 gene=Clim_evmTU58s191